MAEPPYGFLDTDPKSRLYRYSKRAYVIIDKAGIVRYKKVLENARELITNDELLAALDKLKYPAPSLWPANRRGARP